MRLYLPQGFKNFIGSNGEIINPLSYRVVDSGKCDCGHGSADILADSVRSVGTVSQMAFVEEACDDRIIIHGPQVVVDMIEIEPHSGFGTEDLFFRGAFPEAHDRTAVLLPFTSSPVENVSHVVDADYV